MTVATTASAGLDTLHVTVGTPASDATHATTTPNSPGGGGGGTLQPFRQIAWPLSVQFIPA